MATQLGYATTVHTAQGVTVDTMHGLATGAESRQQLYTMITRGRPANHLYLPVVGDGDVYTSNGLTAETAWPALRTRLLLIAATDIDPVATLREAAQRRELGSAADQAAVLAWRLEDTHLHNPAAPLPWLPAVPARIATDPGRGPYLAARARLISDLADQVRTTGQDAAPA